MANVKHFSNAIVLNGDITESMNDRFLHIAGGIGDKHCGRVIFYGGEHEKHAGKIDLTASTNKNKSSLILEPTGKIAWNNIDLHSLSFPSSKYTDLPLNTRQYTPHRTGYIYCEMGESIDKTKSAFITIYVNKLYSVNLYHSKEDNSYCFGNIIPVASGANVTINVFNCDVKVLRFIDVVGAFY